MYDPYAEVKETILPNGLKIYNAHWPGKQFESFKVIVHAGAEFDPPTKEGTAHFLEHMLFQNNNQMSQDEIYDFFNTLGGSIGADTSMLRTTIKTKFPLQNRDKIAEVFKIISNLANNMEIKNGIQKECRVILGEFEQYYPSIFWRKLYHKYQTQGFKNHPRGRVLSPLGIPSSIKRITYETLREFHDQYYVPKNMSIVAVGGMSINEIAEQLAITSFTKDISGKKAKIRLPLKQVIPFKNTFTDIIIPDKQNSGKYRCFIVLPDIFGYYHVKIACNMLGKALLREIREENGLSYGFSINHQYLRCSHALTLSCVGIKADKIDEVSKRVNDTIERIAKSKKFFQLVQNMMISSVDILTDMNSTQLRDGIEGDLVNFGRIIPIQEHASRIKNISWSKVQSIFQHILSKDPKCKWTLLARPF